MARAEAGGEKSVCLQAGNAWPMSGLVFPNARVATHCCKPLLKVKPDVVTVTCPVKPTLGVKMTQFQRGFVTAILIATAPLATLVVPFGSPALAVTCASAQQSCIAQSKAKADRVERCAAARQSCETSGVLLAPMPVIDTRCRSRAPLSKAAVRAVLTVATARATEHLPDPTEIFQSAGRVVHRAP